MSCVSEIVVRQQEVVEEGEYHELIEEEVREGNVGMLMRVMRWFWRTSIRATSSMRIRDNLQEEDILG